MYKGEYQIRILYKKCQWEKDNFYRTTIPIQDDHNTTRPSYLYDNTNHYDITTPLHNTDHHVTTNPNVPTNHDHHTFM